MLSVVVAAAFLVARYNPMLHRNQARFATHACFQQYLLLLCTMYIFLSFIVSSTDRGLNFNQFSSMIATKKPIAKIKNVKLKKLDV